MRSIYENVVYGLRVRGERNRSILDEKVEKALQNAALWDEVKENAPSLAVLKKKIKSGQKLGSTETASAKARGLIKRSDGTKRKSDKYK